MEKLVQLLYHVLMNHGTAFALNLMEMGKIGPGIPIVLVACRKDNLFAYMQNRQREPSESLSNKDRKDSLNLSSQQSTVKLIMIRPGSYPVLQPSFAVPGNTPEVFGSRLISQAGEVVGETLDGRGGVSGNSAVRVVCDDDGLLGLGNGDTGAALSMC